jgi:hypothetical protein
MHLFPPMGESPGGLFIGVVRRSGSNVQTPPNYPIYTECTVIGVSQSFHTSDYFTQGLLHGDMCPF